MFYAGQTHLVCVQDCPTTFAKVRVESLIRVLDKDLVLGTAISSPLTKCSPSPVFMWPVSKDDFSFLNG